MGASVWWSHVDEAWRLFIRDKVQLFTDKGAPVELHVVVRKPDEDFAIEKYPCVSISPLYAMRDTVREAPDYSRLLIEEDVDNHTGLFRVPSKAFSLHYQIDFWADLLLDYSNMTMQWSAKVSRDFLLPIVDSVGEIRKCSVLEKNKGNVLREDAVGGRRIGDSGQRTFRGHTDYRVWVRLDERPDETLPIVTSVEPKTHIKE